MKKNIKKSVPQDPQRLQKSLQNGLQKHTFFNLGTQRGAKGAQDPKNIPKCATGDLKIAPNCTTNVKTLGHKTVKKVVTKISRKMGNAKPRTTYSLALCAVFDSCCCYVPLTPSQSVPRPELATGDVDSPPLPLAGCRACQTRCLGQLCPQQRK